MPSGQILDGAHPAIFPRRAVACCGVAQRNAGSPLADPWLAFLRPACVPTLRRRERERNFREIIIIII